MVFGFSLIGWWMYFRMFFSFFGGRKFNLNVFYILSEFVNEEVRGRNFFI